MIINGLIFFIIGILFFSKFFKNFYSDYFRKQKKDFNFQHVVEKKGKFQFKKQFVIHNNLCFNAFTRI